MQGTGLVGALAATFGSAAVPMAARRAARGSVVMATAPAPLPPFPTEPLRLPMLEPIKQLIDAQKCLSDSVRSNCGACGAAHGDGGVRLRACDGCDAVRYCNRQCQRADWAAHSLACKILATNREIMVRVGGPLEDTRCHLGASQVSTLYSLIHSAVTSPPSAPRWASGP